MPKVDEAKITNRRGALHVTWAERHRHSNIVDNTWRRVPREFGSIRDIAETIRNPIANEIHAPNIDRTREET
jgi:hypothetical protein